MTAGLSSVSLLLVAGARPNFMKVAPILRAARARGVATTLVHTGQHYDENMSGAFFEELGIGAPDVSLEVGSGSQAQQTARVMERIEPVIIKRRPQWVVVVGDVTSTMAAALVGAKLGAQVGCGVAHVEAGLRSFDWSMPEEINRIVTDRVADLLLTPSPEAGENLIREGIPAGRIAFVGNVMVDSLLYQLDRARDPNVRVAAGIDERAFVLVTLHRPSNVDDAGQLSVILDALRDLARETRVVFPMHPRTRGSIERFGLWTKLDGIEVRSPTGYTETVALLDAASAVLTDSGGVQEESTVLGVPCVTLRAQTERPVTVTHGTNVLVDWPITRDGTVHAARGAMARARRPVGTDGPDGWDGRAAERVISALESADRQR